MRRIRRNSLGLSFVLVVGLTLLATAAGAAPWTVDSDHSQVGFTVKHLGITDVDGQFHQATVDLTFDPDDIPASRVDATIVAASIDTGIEKRDKHLRSQDFFDVEKYPTITFKSTGIRDITDRGFTLDGDLTIRGITRPVELKVVRSPILNDPTFGRRIAFSATCSIHRPDFGLTWNRVLDNGGLLVSEDVRVKIQIEAESGD